jgi:hypothetical protein
MRLSTPDEKDRRSVVGQLLLLLVAPGYFELSPPVGGGQASFQGPRIYDAASIAVPAHYACMAEGPVAPGRCSTL